MGYLYETHLHTCEASACGKVHGEDYISYITATHVSLKIFPGKKELRYMRPVTREL